MHRLLHAAGIKPLIENRALSMSELDRMLAGAHGPRTWCTTNPVRFTVTIN